MTITDCAGAERVVLDDLKRQHGFTSDHDLLAWFITSAAKTPAVDLFGEAAEMMTDKGERIARDVLALWNKTVTLPIPPVSKLTKPMREKIRCRWKDYPRMSVFEMVFSEVNQQAWCRGEQKGQHAGWVAELSWVLGSEQSFQRFVDLGLVRQRSQSQGRVANCQHRPPCADPSACTARTLRELRGANV